ncbi:MAG TPA: TonB family protein [Verrucomicrobiae bacterium]|jgi:TonB family protein|nr:TonB family protein [Verrucomicrobiae bacterium]
MPITQIPFQDPVAPPEKPQPEQLGLYDQRDWETAYREIDDRVPHLLIQLQDDLERSRWREAIYISIIVHLVLAIFLWKLDFLEKYVGWHTAVVVPLNANHDKDVTFLALPPDAQKLTHRPRTNVQSDKDRESMSRTPDLNAHRLITPPPGAPGMRGPRSPQPGPSIAPSPPQMMAQSPPAQQPQPQQQEQGSQRPQFQSDQNQSAQLRMPTRPNAADVFDKYAAGMSAGSAIQQATEAAAARRGGGGGDNGDFGLDRGAHGRQYGNMEILSDTQGVDFGPYLQRILEDVRQNWYHLIPESAEMKKGKLALEFAIMKDGRVQGLKLVYPSGDVALDRPAIGSITASDPFPPLPTEFTGPYLELRFRFYYNPDKGDLE